jgi:hypothetical protein
MNNLYSYYGDIEAGYRVCQVNLFGHVIRARQSLSMAPAGLFVSQRTGSHSAGISGTTWSQPLLHRHNRLSFGKFQDTERFLIFYTRHVSSRLPPSREACKYVMAPITQINLEIFSNYWYVPFCCVYLPCCAVELGSSGGTYELLCIMS